MLLTTQITLALQCSHCDKLTLHTLSRFNFSSSYATKVLCDCGNDLISVSRKSKGQYQLSLLCPICEVRHSYTLAGNTIWSQGEGCLPLTCENTNVEIGFIGEMEEVAKCVKRVDLSLKEIAEEFGYDKYFVNADIMYQVLEIVRKTLEAGRISCACSSEQLKPEVCPDRIELVCSHCGATGIVFAETGKDLQNAMSLGNIRLEASSFQYLDRKGPSNKKKLKQ